MNWWFILNWDDIFKVIRVFKVQGHSMHPVLSGGDFVFTSRYYRTLCVGDLIIFQHPNYGCLLKRIKVINSAGDLRVSGENEFSLSSDQMGWISSSSLKGKVFFKSRYKSK